MRRFEYGQIQSLSWKMDILSLIAGIYRANGKEEVLLSQSPAILDSLVELAKVQSTEASNAIEGLSLIHILILSIIVATYLIYMEYLERGVVVYVFVF